MPTILNMLSLKIALLIAVNVAIGKNQIIKKMSYH